MHTPPSGAEAAVRALYQELLNGWNQRSATAMAAPFAEDGELIGYDGSHIVGRADIVAHLQPIFAHHLTPTYVSKIRSVRLLDADTAILLAITGFPNGQTDLNPALNALQTLVAVKRGDAWQVALFQNTPAQFHGRPELVQQMTDELRAARTRP